MSVARVIEVTAVSTKSFEDAIQVGINRVHKTMRNVKSAWIKDQSMNFEDGRVAQYQVNMLVTFVLDDKDDLS